MTDRDALLRAICDNPEDDAPRLIYADWLDEHGDPRQAEFIREHIALAHVPWSDLNWRPEAARLLELWRELRKWRYPLGDWRSFSLNSFVRGFNTHWRGPVPAFLKLLPTPGRFGPITILTLELDNPLPGPPALANTVTGLTALTRLTEVRLIGNHVTEEWRIAVETCPAAARWESFRAWAIH